MSDESLSNAGVASVAGESAGQLLRRAREASGLHIAALAVAMKVPVKKLEALEADRLSELPDAVFVRALAASMCRTLKVDPAPILSKLPQSVTPKLESDDRGVNMPFHGSSNGFAGPAMGLLKKPAVLTVLALLVAAAVVVLVPDMPSRGEASMKASNEPAPAPAPAQAPVTVPTPAVAGSDKVGTAPVSDPQVRVAGVEAPAAAASAPAVPAIPAAKDVAKRASAPVAGPVAAATASVAAVTAPVEAVMQFKAKSSAWVRVTDAKGVIQLEKTLAAGEIAGAGGALPLSVVVGNVGATDVEVRGQAFSLDAFNKSNVARFEVK